MADTAVTCPVCMEAYMDPQLLSSCGHTFCRRCVKQMHPQLCPLCRGPFRSEDVRPNYALMRMMEPTATASAPPQSFTQCTDATLLAHQAMTEAPAAPFVANQDASQRIAKGLMHIGVPFGVSQLIGEEDQMIGLRIFLLDNSGSTSSYDGKYLEQGPDGKRNVVTCSRWQEIKRMALDQAHCQIATGTLCEFVLLNPISGQGGLQEGIDICSIDPSRGDAEAQLAALRGMLDKVRPNGATPLAQSLRQIHTRITTVHGNLARQGLRTVVVVATDGLPTSTGGYKPTDAAKNEVVQVMRQLSVDLPVFLVIRLCTDEDDVVAFYNRIDEEEELPLEVIDDLESEAQEICDKGNDWLTYSPMIHMIREGGTFVKLFDLLDERKLNPLEARLLAGHLLQLEDWAPLPLSDVKEFTNKAADYLQKMEKVYDPLQRRMKPSIDMRKLRQAVKTHLGFRARFQGLLHVLLPCVFNQRDIARQALLRQ